MDDDRAAAPATRHVLEALAQIDVGFAVGVALFFGTEVVAEFGREFVVERLELRLRKGLRTRARRERQAERNHRRQASGGQQISAPIAHCSFSVIWRPKAARLPCHCAPSARISTCSLMCTFCVSGRIPPPPAAASIL